MWSIRNGAGAAAAAAVNLPCGTAGVVTRWWGRRSVYVGDNGGLFPRTPPCSRPLHCSAVCCILGTRLAKFLAKKQKKSRYVSPTLISRQDHKPSHLAGVLKLSPPKFRTEDSVRKRCLESLLFKAVGDVLNTCEVSEEVYDLRLELSKASLTSDFSTCRLYWRTTGSAEQDEHVGRLVNKSAKHIRSILISHQVLTNVPFLQFVQDRKDAAIKEIERLLAIADFGPEEDNEPVESNISEQRSPTTDTCLGSSHPPIYSNLFGIDHDALNMKITEYKQMKKDSKIEGIGLSEQQKQQLTEIRKQKKMKMKKSKKIPNDDLTPREYLMDKYNEDYSDCEMASSEEDPLKYADELEDDLEVEDKDTNYK